MQKTIKAIYENGVLKPLQKVKFRERQKITLTILKAETPKIVKRKKAKQHPIYRISNLFESGLKDLSQSPDKYLYPKEETPL